MHGSPHPRRPRPRAGGVYGNSRAQPPEQGAGPARDRGRREPGGDREWSAYRERPYRERAGRARERPYQGRERPRTTRERAYASRERDARRVPGDEPGPPPERRRRRRTPIWATLTATAGALLMLLSGTAIAGYEVLNNRYAGNVQQENLLGDTAAAAPPGEELEGPLNLLLLGVEERGEGARSDTIIVLHIPASHDQAYLISVPRDTWVSVPEYGDMKITDTFNQGYERTGEWSDGTALVATTLSNLTGLQFNGAAIVNFNGFEKIIDELGGLDFCFDTAATSEHLVLYDGKPIAVGKANREGIYPTEPIRYEEGCQKDVEGWRALDYARQRKTLESNDGDYGRQRHQQQLLKAMVDAAKSRDVVTNLSKLDSLVLAAGDALVVDTNQVELADFVFTLKDVKVGDLTLLRTNGGEFNSAGIQGVSAEALTPESLDMFQAAADDTMANFVVNHPEFVNRDD